MEKLIDLYEILKNAPRGMELYVPEIGTLYLHTVSTDDYRNGWLGDDVAIKLTKRKPRYERHMIGGYCQYRYEEIDYCFDRYGRMYLTDPHYQVRDDRSLMKAGEQYLYNGRKFLTTNCMLFPDEKMTWFFWQHKLYKPGDYIMARGDRSDEDKNIIAIFESFSGGWGECLGLKNAAIESFDSKKIRRTEFKPEGEFAYVNFSRFATVSEINMWYDIRRDYLNNVKIK